MMFGRGISKVGEDPTVREAGVSNVEVFWSVSLAVRTYAKCYQYKGTIQDIQKSCVDDLMEGDISHNKCSAGFGPEALGQNRLFPHSW